MATPRKHENERRARHPRTKRMLQRIPRGSPRPTRAAYLPHGHALQIQLANGASLTIPVHLIPALRAAPPRELRAVEVRGRRGELCWDSLDLALTVSRLVSSVFAGPSWMAELGRIGGRQSTAAKAAAARRNGRMGGRPRKHPLARRSHTGSGRAHASRSG